MLVISLPYDPALAPWGVLSEKWNHMSIKKKNLYKNIHSSPIHNDSELEITQTNWIMAKQIMVCLYTRIWNDGTRDLCNNREWISKTLRLVKEHYVQNSECCLTSFMWNLKKARNFLWHGVGSNEVYGLGARTIRKLSDHTCIILDF